MTTITTESIAHDHIGRSRRSIVTFVAGVALATGVAAGITVVHDGGAPAARVPHAVQGQPTGTTDPGCRLHLGGPC